MVALLRPNTDSAVAGLSGATFADPSHSVSGGSLSVSGRSGTGGLRLVVANDPASEVEEFTLGGWVIDRRAVTVMVASLIVVMGGLFFVRGIQGEPAAPTWDGVSQASAVDSVEVPASVAGPGDLVIVAKPGDSMWSIAKTIAPESDPRPVVETLIAANGGETLRIGQQIVIPEQLLD